MLEQTGTLRCRCWGYEGGMGKSPWFARWRFRHGIWALGTGRNCSPVTSGCSPDHSLSPFHDAIGQGAYGIESSYVRSSYLGVTSQDRAARLRRGLSATLGFSNSVGSPTRVLTVSSVQPIGACILPPGFTTEALMRGRRAWSCRPFRSLRPHGEGLAATSFLREVPLISSESALFVILRCVRRMPQRDNQRDPRA